MLNIQKSIVGLVVLSAVTAGCSSLGWSSETFVVTLTPVANSGLSGRVEFRHGGGGKSFQSTVESWVMLEGVGLNSTVLSGTLYSGTCTALGAFKPENRQLEINKMTPAGVYGNKTEQPEFHYLIDGVLDDLEGGHFAFVVYVNNSKRPVACGDIQ